MLADEAKILFTFNYSLRMEKIPIMSNKETKRMDDFQDFWYLFLLSISLIRIYNQFWRNTKGPVFNNFGDLKPIFNTSFLFSAKRQEDNIYVIILGIYFLYISIGYMVIKLIINAHLKWMNELIRLSMASSMHTQAGEASYIYIYIWKRIMGALTNEVKKKKNQQCTSTIYIIQ